MRLLQLQWNFLFPIRTPKRSRSEYKPSQMPVLCFKILSPTLPRGKPGSLWHHLGVQKLMLIPNRCLSIPVTLRAALKHPTQMLGSKPAMLLQQYSQSMKDFDLSVRSEDSKDDDEVCITGTAPMDISDHVTMLGREQKLTNMM